MAPTLYMASGVLCDGRHAITLGARESAFLAAVTRSKTGLHREIIEQVWPCPDCQPVAALNTMSVAVVKVNTKLARFGLKIAPPHEGYREGRRRLWGGDINIDWRKPRPLPCSCTKQMAA